MLGVKIKTVKTKNEYTIEEFYDAIKDKSFSAGAPALTKHGFSTIVTFPPLDRRNQIWIVPVLGVGKKKASKFQLCAQPRVCSLTGGNPVYPRPNQPDISESWDGASNDT